MPTVDKRAGRLGLAMRAGRRVACIIKVGRNLIGYSLSAKALSMVTRAELGTMAAEFVGYENGKSTISIEVTAALSAELGVGTFGWMLSALPPNPFGASPEDVVGGVLEIEP